MTTPYTAIILLLIWMSPAASAAQQHAVNAGSCPADEQPPSPSDQQGTTSKSCSTSVPKQQVQHHTSAALDAAELQEQQHTQKLLLYVLGNVTAGVITAQAALTLLQDVTALRASLAHGAAAGRWAKLKARSSSRGQLLQQDDKGQPKRHAAGAEHQQGSAAQPQAVGRSAPSRGILIVAGGQPQLMNAHILLQLLRSPSIDCRLPAEVVYYGRQEYNPKAAGEWCGRK